MEIELDLSPEVCQTAVAEMAARNDAIEFNMAVRAMIEFHAMLARMFLVPKGW